MSLIASFDIGTTAVKGVIVSSDGNVIGSKSKNIKTIYDGELKEQDPNEWYRLFCSISKELLHDYCKSDEIIGIVMSGQMQDLIMVDSDMQPIMNAILYSDNRAEIQAEKILTSIGREKISDITANNFDGTMPFAKLLWVKEHNFELYNKIHKILISSKDYCVTRLTGEFATDPTSGSTSGMMNIRNKEWQRELLSEIGLTCDVLPIIKYTHERIGRVTYEASIESGYNIGTPVYCGSGDAGATTLASGICRPGEFNINLGTSGWVACVSKEPVKGEGIFNLAAIPRDIYVNVVPFLNAGNVHKWITSIVAAEENQKKYDYVAELLIGSTCGSHGLMFLPYLSGERFPVIDSNTKGCFIGLTPETTKATMVQACLEGVAFSIRQGIETIGVSPIKLSLVGGGTKSVAWCQIFADMLNIQVDVYEDSEYMPAISIASSVLLNQGIIDDYSEFIDLLLSKQGSIVYVPDRNNVEVYNKMFSKYKQIYGSVAGLFNNYNN